MRNHYHVKLEKKQDLLVPGLCTPVQTPLMYAAVPKHKKYLLINSISENFLSKVPVYLRG